MTEVKKELGEPKLMIFSRDCTNFPSSEGSAKDKIVQSQLELND